MYTKTHRPWLRSFAAEAQGGGSSSKPNAEQLTELANGTTSSAQEGGSETSETPERTETPEKGSEAVGDTKEAWEEHFPDQTPVEVQASIDEWKKRSREWEKRSKENYSALEKLRAESGDEGSSASAQLQDELHMYQDVVAYAIANGTAAQIPDLVDSVSFRQAHSLLDREDEDYETKLGDLITKRLGPAPAPVERAPHQTSGTETYRDHSKTVGDQLYEELYGSKK